MNIVRYEYQLNLYHPALAVNKINKNTVNPLTGQYWLETDIWYKQHEGFLKQTKIMLKGLSSEICLAESGIIR